MLLGPIKVQVLSHDPQVLVVKDLLYDHESEDVIKDVKYKLLYDTNGINQSTTKTKYKLQWRKIRKR